MTEMACGGTLAYVAGHHAAMFGKPKDCEAGQKRQTKKKRAWSPLKTTRYGVSARRPKEEPGL
jgi:hypothetical protein